MPLINWAIEVVWYKIIMSDIKYPKFKLVGMVKDIIFYQVYISTCVINSSCEHTVVDFVHQLYHYICSNA